jgi:hypothetical protein
MSLIGFLAGRDQYKAATNAVLAQHVLTRLDSGQKKAIVTSIVNRLKSKYHYTEEDIVLTLNNDDRICQLNLVAHACHDLRMPPTINDGRGWRRLRHPLISAGFVKQKQLESAIDHIRQKTGISVDWPGSDVKIDFLPWWQSKAWHSCGRPGGCDLAGNSGGFIVWSIRA